MHAAEISLYIFFLLNAVSMPSSNGMVSSAVITVFAEVNHWTIYGCGRVVVISLETWSCWSKSTLVSHLCYSGAQRHQGKLGHLWMQLFASASILTSVAREISLSLSSHIRSYTSQAIFLRDIAAVEVAEEGRHQVLDTGWNVEEAEGKGDELMWDRAICIHQIQPNYMKI